jgi:molybdenum cofactor cytidylyltransferase
MVEYTAIVLAAGLSARYRAAGGPESSKALAILDGKPLVRHVAENALASSARPVIVVTGHARQDVEQALAGLPVRLVHNDDFASGIAASLRAGINAAPDSAAAAFVLLADMPFISARLLDFVGAAFAKHPGTWAIVPTFNGQRGHPVLLSRALFGRIEGLDGDQGARQLLTDAPQGEVVEVEVNDEAAIIDIDDSATLKKLRGI